MGSPSTSNPRLHSSALPDENPGELNRCQGGFRQKALGEKLPAEKRCPKTAPGGLGRELLDSQA